MTDLTEVLTVTEELKLHGARLLAECQSLEIKDDTTCTLADRKIQDGAGIRKEVELKLQPFKEQIKQMRALVKEAEDLVLTPVNAGCQVLVEKMAAYQVEREEIITALKEEHRKKSKEAEKIRVFDMEEAGYPEVAIQSAREMLDRPPEPIVVETYKPKTTIKSSWEVELIHGQERKIPYEYLVPKNETMRKAVAANIKQKVIASDGRTDQGEFMDIEGVRIMPVTKSIQRRRK